MNSKSTLPPSNQTVGLKYQDYFVKNLYLKMVCVDYHEYSNQYDTFSLIGLDNLPLVYWELSTNESYSTGLYFYLLPDLVTDALSGVLKEYSIIGFYATIIYLIGRTLRSVFSQLTEQIWYTDIPKGEKLLRVCEGVIAARNDGNIVKEETLYFQLIDLLRSPEILKIISGSYLRHFKDKEELKIKQLEKKNELEKRVMQEKKKKGSESSWTSKILSTKKKTKDI